MLSTVFRVCTVTCGSPLFLFLPRSPTTGCVPVCMLCDVVFENTCRYLEWVKDGLNEVVAS